MRGMDAPPARPLDRRLLVFALLWMLALYTVTALAANLTPALKPAVLEVRNVVSHATAYAVQIGLVAGAYGWPRRALAARERRCLLALALALGVGQEALQTVLRARAFPLNSLFDLLVDVTGAALGLWIMARIAPLRRPRAPG